MKKVVSLLMLMLICIGFAIAEPVGADRARQVAVNFLKSTEKDAQQLSVQDLVDITATTPFREFYVFSVREKGFILVSGDDRALPILGYSLNNTFVSKGIPAHVRWWLDNYEKQIKDMREQAIEPSQETSSQWQLYSESNPALDLDATTVGPLLSTTWNQSPYYNTQCPYDASAYSCAGNNYALAGCVAISTAQIMKYWNWPTTGQGSHSYTHSSYGTLSADFATTYSWSNMPNSLSSSSTSTQINAVAKLVYHVGVALEMNYGPCGSSASTYGAYYPSSQTILPTYFKYNSSTITSISEGSYSATNWINQIKNEIDNSRPLLYRGSGSAGGHSFVCDGYNSSDQLHFNWGWGGRYDGFFTPGSLNPGSYTFNSGCVAVIGIQPANTTTYTITASANPTAGGTVSGGGSYTSGTTCTLRATPASGYVFTNWTSGSTVLSTSSTYSFTVTSNKTIKANFTPRYTITVTANPTAGGTVTGGGTYNSGSSCTLRATPASGYTFTNWTSGSTVLSTNATYTFTVSASKTIKANFTYQGNCGINYADLPYTDNFDSYTTSTTAKTGVQPTCWTLAHQDVTMTDEYKPMIYYASANAHSGNYSLLLNKRGIYAMPRVETDVNLLKLQFYLKQNQAKYQLQVGVMTNLSDASTFVPVATLNNSSTTTSVLQTVDFSSYTGLGHYIAFRNVLAPGNTGDYSCNYIDDLTLSRNTSACTLSVSNLPYTDNFDSYTTSTTAKTGVEPPCWNLAHQDVAMTDDYKPMVYYSASNAHSGRYSLILNKRGIYTMPYFNGTVRNLQLSLYVMQTQTKYQLQVGVMSNLQDASTFVPIATINNSGTDAVLHTVSFSSYTGSGHYIAFRNVLAAGNSGDFSCNFIDDITLSNTSAYTITASANPIAGGTVTGGGTYTSGSTCTLRATPNANYTFTNWTSGSTVLSTNATYTFTVSASKTIKANFTPVSTCGIAVADLPYTDNFDSYTTSTIAKTGVEPDCWTLAHQDVTMADEYKPMIYYASGNANSGSYSLLLNKRGIYAMPEFAGDVSTLQLSMYVKQGQAKYQLQVGVMSDLSNASTFVPVATINNASTTASVLCTVDFSSYTGTGHYIAFRNVLASGYSGDYSCNYIDDITLELRPSGCSAIQVADLPYTDNFDSYTTSTTAKTGVEPDCWTLAHQDVTMADEYKPMIYYASSNAHSGSYSLLLNKRGIYAMPEFAGDVSTLQLSMYVKQGQAKYQLQVGVMSDLSNASTFVPVATINNASTSASVLCTVDFSSYTGSGHYIAFRNVLASGQSGEYSCNYIDDITLELRPSGCSAIRVTDLPYTDNFDSYTTSTTAKTCVEPDCWTLAHQDVTMTDAYKPMIYYASGNAHSSSYSLLLNKRGIYAMPEFAGDVSTLQLSMYVKQGQAKYQLQVGVMSDLSNASTFVPVATINNASTSASVLCTVDFSSYTGSGHYIAFRNVLASGQSGEYSCNYIDDIRLELRPTDPCTLTAADLPYTDNFDSYTTSTTAKTGVEPTCWTLAHQDVTMTDAYKPMIYYSPANANSGSYSLILNKRGIYAMPPYNGNVNTLQLQFYVKQSALKNQLQVGVMSDLNNASTFVPVATIDNTGYTAFEYKTVSFTSYTGSGHYIAFRNVLASGYSGDYSCNYIDDLTLRVVSAKGALPDDGLAAPVQHTLAVYPNPTTGLLNVAADEEVLRVDVFDYTGRRVASFERQTEININQLPTGIYTLRMTLPERIEVRRVVKQ